MASMVALHSGTARRGAVDDTALDRRRRHDMLRQQVLARGVRNPHVIRAMARIPRHLFLEPAQRSQAYSDQALPVAEQQTISQPLIVAVMTEALEVQAGHRILEVGTGTGYQTAILALLAGRVYTLERFAALSREAQSRLHALGLDNVEYRIADGTLGWPEQSPFERIIVTAGAPEVPEPLWNQLAEGGRLVIPLGDRHSQTLKKIARRNGRRWEVDVLPCRFVPLVGLHGW